MFDIVRDNMPVIGNPINAPIIVTVDSRGFRRFEIRYLEAPPADYISHRTIDYRGLGPDNIIPIEVYWNTGCTTVEMVLVNKQICIGIEQALDES
jgi:hypothetical protein